MADNEGIDMDTQLIRSFAALAIFLCLLGLARYRTPSTPPPLPSRTANMGAAVEVVDGPEAAALREGRRMNINRATAEEFRLLPGIGPALAQRIVTTRDARGRFERVEDLLDTPGIGARSLARFRPLVEVSNRADPARPVASGP